MPIAPASSFSNTSHPPHTLGQVSVLGSSTMAEDTLILISQLQDETSGGKRDLWDFGSYPERKGNGLLFEKEVLDIQVGKL